ncbi:MAG: hypothetical protein RJA99_2685 [Pseudomonadota bacterium]|jgi:hypothetical protein
MRPTSYDARIRGSFRNDVETTMDERRIGTARPTTEPAPHPLARLLATTRADWQRVGRARLTPRAPATTFAPSLIADAGETGPRTSVSGQAPAPKVYRPGNSQAKGPHRIGLSGE